MAKKTSYFIPRFVILFAVFMAVCLGFAIWDINPWPTDAEAYYMPAALRLPHLQFISELHPTFDIEKVRWLHGKEFYIAGISIFQHLLNDFDSLRPLMLLGLVSVALSAIFIFFLARRFWGEKIALFCYFAFVFSFWPYLYILFAKHQTLGLMLFLLACAFLLNLSQTKSRFFWLFMSGLSLGLSLFASTVSSLYLPFYAALLVVFVGGQVAGRERLEQLKFFAGSALLVAAGFFLIFVYVNLPDIIHNIKSFQEYVVISGAFNHFYYNQIHLQQWMPHANVGMARGGWEWVIKYFFVAMPVLFPVYLAAVVYLCVRIAREKSWINRLKILALIVLSWTPPLMAETVRVAQYGANYFPILMGVIMLLGYVAYDLKRQGFRIEDLRLHKFSLNPKSKILNPFFVILLVHGVVNFYLFATDVYPCRMATTILSAKIKELGVDRLWSYRVNRHRNYFMFSLNVDLRDKIGWIPLQYLPQADSGYILVPPSTGDSLYIASRSSYHNFDKDPFLIEMIRKGLLKDCAVASFRTLANSQLWVHEEEILSYRQLILGQKFPPEHMGRAWLLDVKKVREHMAQLIPPKSEAILAKGQAFNIGTAEKFYIFTGQRGEVFKPTKFKALVVKLWKVGDPQDGVTAAMFRSDKIQDTWIPFEGNSLSQVIPAANIQDAVGRGVAVFNFDPPLDLDGQFYFAIFRTGKPDDHNFYQIDSQRFGIK